jgi:hypothetical protein
MLCAAHERAHERWSLSDEPLPTWTLKLITSVKFSQLTEVDYLSEVQSAHSASLRTQRRPRESKGVRPGVARGSVRNNHGAAQGAQAPPLASAPPFGKQF